VTAKLVLGADGVHSVVRASLFGADAPEFAGVVAWRGVVPMDEVPESISRNIGTNWIGPGGHVVHYPLRAGKLLNFVGHVERSDWTVESWTVRGTSAELANDYRGWHPHIHAMIRNIEAPYKFAVKHRPPMEVWSKGRCTLLGDACPSMVPFLAQGAVMALEDARLRATRPSAGSARTRSCWAHGRRVSGSTTRPWPTPRRRKPMSRASGTRKRSRSVTSGCSSTTPRQFRFEDR
jgi:salicylate hydroxylase